MLDFLNSEQNANFPEKINVIIIGKKNESCIPIYFYVYRSIYPLFGKFYQKVPYHIGVIPRAVDELYAVPSIIVSNYEFPRLITIEARPVLFVKVAKEIVYNFIVCIPTFENINVNPDEIKDFLKGFLDLGPEQIIIESEHKAKAYLIHCNKKYQEIKYYR